jgi:phytol kinase
MWWRRHVMHSEFSRKSVHITVGSFVAAWPFFLEWWQITTLSLAFLVAIGISLKLNVFQAIHSVQRPTWGEVFFAVAVGACALITHDKWVYAAALLQMSLADGMAAVIGTRYGHSQKYLMFGHAKSVAGTLTFFVVSFAVLFAYSRLGPHELTLGLITGISLLATIIENVAVRGLDNLLVPVAVALLLMHV